MVTPDPVPATRLQFALDYVPTVSNGSDGFKHLQFTNFCNFSSIAGGLLEVEVLIDGNWSLGATETGGVSRIFTPSSPALPWTIVEDFVYQPGTNQTRFYATRISTGLGTSEGAFLQGYMIGSAVPSVGSLVSVVCAGGLTGVRRRR